MKKDINNIHDKSYKTLFSNKDIFLNLINDFTEEQWKKELLANTLSEEIKDVALSILDADKEEVDKMTANITRTIEEIKEDAIERGRSEREIELAKALLVVLDDETIATKTKLPLEQVKKLRQETLRDIEG